ncbi:MAG: efflux RND transporter periplasmic adaptor subunit [Deltaproteobacteria bacterium]|nr:efflux RND transporter periplasmic adaptor subunit [Deltaproteobacteria bacterium]
MKLKPAPHHPSPAFSLHHPDKNPPRPFFFLIGLWLSATLFVFGCGSQKKADPAAGRRDRPVPVSVSTVLQKTIPLEVSGIGNAEAYSTVSVKSRVGGELKKVHFREGQEIRQGDLIFTIDPQPYEAALRQAQANLARATALAKKAEEDLKRYQDLIQKDYISREQYDQAQANADAQTAALKADQAAVENARLNLSYCFIQAPLTGVAGSLLFHQGAQIKANDDRAMVTINRVQPIYVSFSVPESTLPEIKKYSARGPLKVRVSGNDGGTFTEAGLLTFIDNTVDLTTGTIRLKGTFDNNNKTLWPGQFLRVTLALSVQPNALLVPTPAVQTGVQGQYVFVATPEQKAEARPVTVGRNLDGQTVIEKGLQAGEQVVTDGQFQLVPGSRLQIKNALSTPGAHRP